MSITKTNASRNPHSSIHEIFACRIRHPGNFSLALGTEAVRIQAFSKGGSMTSCFTENVTLSQFFPILIMRIFKHTNEINNI